MCCWLVILGDAGDHGVPTPVRRCQVGQQHAEGGERLEQEPAEGCRWLGCPWSWGAHRLAWYRGLVWEQPCGLQLGEWSGRASCGVVVEEQELGEETCARSIHAKVI
jgi:hypothetical protein